MSLAEALDMRSGEGAGAVLRGATVLDPVAGIEGVHDVIVRDGRVAELAAPGAAAEGLEEIDAEGLHAFPARSTRRTSRPAAARPPPAATAA